MTDTAPSASSETPNDRHYALWAVLRREPGTPVPEGLPSIVDAAATAGDALRGVYDVSGLRADADILLWLVGHTAEHLQAVLRDLRRTRELAALAPTWNALGVHRDAEFSRDHSPAFARGLAPKQWLTVYPFVRSYEWYLLPAAERGAMLGEHGRMGRDYPQVQSNTVASFALGDYEWLLALEADDVIDLVDLMRYLRATEARRHVREEVPFFTGRLIQPAEIADVVR
ncbi:MULTISPECIES: hydrogen peroxide-dependent heme synthase [unclassified Microbacterium]|uniref:hydrogen peroxide-dependent heme synthase n=1 Tax=unclassified Microbacterium TaxID=2609290 RepID=UPI000F54D017|nr:hydrogen peroxide-dependent heme synthase [Microbacterium sp. ABRD28]AZC14383.1 chlorite dismutase [Microbacterium sp. ABRD28]